MKKILIFLFALTLSFLGSEKPAQAFIISCFDLTGIDFGDCATPLGYALLDGECQTINGCGTTDSNGNDYSFYIYDDFQVCYTSCGIDYSNCVDPVLQSFEVACDDVYEPVCGCDGITYPNYCTALYEGGATTWTGGECPTINDCSQPYWFYDLSWIDEYNLNSGGFRVTMQSLNGENVFYYEVCNPFSTDGINTLFDCNGNIICPNLATGGGYYSYEDCPDFVSNVGSPYLPYYTVIPCDGSNCTYDNPATDIPFVDSLITALSQDIDDCYYQIYSSLEMVNFGVTEAFLLMPSGIVPDAPYQVFDCEGNLLCASYEEGNTTPPFCMGLSSFDYIQTLWTCEDGLIPEGMIQMSLGLRVKLEGPLDEDGDMIPMDPTILAQGHPYAAAPYNYNGPELTGLIPNNAVDYVLIELREDFGMEPVAQQVAFVRDFGIVVAEDGTSPNFLIESGKTYQVWIRHHNHLDIVSSTEITPAPSVYYPFEELNQAMGAQQLKEVNGVYTMYAGDINGDGVINVSDYDAWALSPAVVGQYTASDINLDGVVQATDYDLWFKNKAKIGFAQNQD